MTAAKGAADNFECPLMDSLAVLLPVSKQRGQGRIESDFGNAAIERGKGSRQKTSPPEVDQKQKPRTLGASA